MEDVRWVQPGLVHALVPLRVLANPLDVIADGRHVDQADDERLFGNLSLISALAVDEGSDQGGLVLAEGDARDSVCGVLADTQEVLHTGADMEVQHQLGGALEHRDLAVVVEVLDALDEKLLEPKLFLEPVAQQAVVLVETPAKQTDVLADLSRRELLEFAKLFADLVVQILVGILGGFRHVTSSKVQLRTGKLTRL